MAAGADAVKALGQRHDVAQLIVGELVEFRVGRAAPPRGDSAADRYRGDAPVDVRKRGARQAQSVIHVVVAVERAPRHAELGAVQECAPSDQLMRCRHVVHARAHLLARGHANGIGDFPLVVGIAEERRLRLRELAIGAQYRVVLDGLAVGGADELAAIGVDRPPVGQRIRVDVGQRGRVLRHGTVAERLREDIERLGRAKGFAQPLVSREDEKPIPPDRPPGGESELIALEVGLFLIDRIEVPAGVEIVAAMELEQRSAEAVGAGFRDRVDHRAGVTAELRAERVGQHLELADRLDAKDVAGGAARLVELIVQHGAVDREQVGGVTRAVDAQLGAEPGTGAAAAVVGELHTRCQIGELNEASAVERQPRDLLLADQRAGRCRPHVDGRRLADDGDLILQRAHSERDVDDRLATHRQTDAASRHAAEPGQRRSDFVRPGTRFGAA